MGWDGDVVGRGGWLKCIEEKRSVWNDLDV